MNIPFWILQVLLAFHTGAGAGWKLSNSEQKVPSLSAIPHGIWMSLIGVELLCVIGLLLPAINKSLGISAPIAASCIALEMLLFTGVHFSSGTTEHGEVIYWLVVAAFCAVIAYGRFVALPF